MFRRFCKWFKERGWKYMIVATVVYVSHVFIETLIVTNVLALFGMSMPTVV